jgi:Tol biopolymer transport system component
VLNWTRPWRSRSGRFSRSRLLSRHARSTLALVAVCVASGVAVSEASFPGRNGLIAFVREGPPFDRKPPREGGAWTIWVADPRTGRTRQFTHVSRRCRRRGWTWTDEDPSFSASGRLIAYVHEDSCDPRTPDGIYVMRADGSGRRLIRRTASDEIKEFPAFSPSGALLAFSELYGDTSILRIRQPRAERGLSGCPSGSTRCPLLRYSAVVQPAWSPTGRLAVTLSGPNRDEDVGHIGTVTPNREGLRLVTRSRRDAMPDWSPTGDRIVFHRETWTGRAFKGNVLVAPARRKRHRRPRRLTETHDAYFPVWSPNGRNIAYVRDPNAFLGPGSLWIMRANDGGGRRLVATNLVSDRISWQPRPRSKKRSSSRQGETHGTPAPE